MVNEITSDGRVNYSFDSIDNGGLELEAMGIPGDSGGGALVERDGKLWHIGVKSYYINNIVYDTGYNYAYIYTGGQHSVWLNANIASLTNRISAIDIGCTGPTAGDGQFVDQTITELVREAATAS